MDEDAGRQEAVDAFNRAAGQLVAEILLVADDAHLSAILDAPVREALDRADALVQRLDPPAEPEPVSWAAYAEAARVLEEAAVALAGRRRGWQKPRPLRNMRRAESWAEATAVPS